MFNKIDKRILEKIRSLKIDEKMDVILFASSNENARKYLTGRYDFDELSIINCFVLKCEIVDLIELSNQNFVNFISSNTKVNSLINKSKKFVHMDVFDYNKLTFEKHSVAIIDTGIYPHIDFLLGKNRIIKFVDFINETVEMYDDNGHGTFIAGIIGGKSIVNNYDGFDNNCNIIAIKALDKNGETTSVKILEAMQWVLDNKEKFNIKVVCMSFGSIMGEMYDPLMFGVEVLWNNGIAVVCAAGNSGPKPNTIMSPGSSKKIITIGSLSENLNYPQVAEFSSRGPVFNYFKPDMLLPGENIISTNIFEFDHKFYTTMSGTSVSTPMVAGIVSLLYNINPNYSPDQIKYMLINSCVKITGDKSSEGYGYLDLRKLILL